MLFHVAWISRAGPLGSGNRRFLSGRMWTWNDECSWVYSYHPQLCIDYHPLMNNQQRKSKCSLGCDFHIAGHSIHHTSIRLNLWGERKEAISVKSHHHPKWRALCRAEVDLGMRWRLYCRISWLRNCRPNFADSLAWECKIRPDVCKDCCGMVHNHLHMSIIHYMKMSAWIMIAS